MPQLAGNLGVARESFFLIFRHMSFGGRKSTIEGIEGHSSSDVAQRLARNTGPGVSKKAGDFLK